jgi:hypothetical protein
MSHPLFNVVEFKATEKKRVEAMDQSEGAEPKATRDKSRRRKRMLVKLNRKSMKMKNLPPLFFI